MGMTLTAVLNFIVFTGLCSMGVYCYILCVIADPGSVPRDYQHDLEDVTSAYIQVKPPALLYSVL
jgi:hypothetical protein